jgi:AcrR family transcriptional regulator
VAASRERNPRGTGGRLRDEIIDAGIALIDQTGDPTALTLRGVARVAGISAPSIYPHFPDLDAVRDAVLERSFTHLEANVGSAIDAESDPAQALFAAATAYVQFGWQHRARYRLMFAGTGFAPNAVNTYALVEELLVGCVETGRSKSTDPHQDTFLIWVALHGIATLERPDRNAYLRLGPLDRPALVLTLVERLALLVPPPTSPRVNNRRTPR